MAGEEINIGNEEPHQGIKNTEIVMPLCTGDSGTYPPL